MNMKDKLQKNHHKGIYYRAKKVFLSSLFILAFSATILIPTYIAVKTTSTEKMNKAAEESEVVENSGEQTNAEMLTF